MLVRTATTIRKTLIRLTASEKFFLSAFERIYNWVDLQWCLKLYVTLD